MTRGLAVVDDEEALRVAVARVLRLKGFSVVEAADGESALKLLRDPAAAFDVLLLDATLPDIPAADVFAAVAAERPAVLVVVTSAYPRDEALRLTGAPSGWPFIRKPYHIDELIRLIESARA